MTEDISSDFQELESGKTGFERIASPVVVYRSMTPKSRKVRLGITLSGEVYDQIMGKTPRFSVAFSPRNYSLKIEHKEGGKIEVFEPHKGERRVFRVEMPPGIDIDDDVRHACRYDIIAGTLYVVIPEHLRARPKSPDYIKPRPGVANVVRSLDGLMGEPPPGRSALDRKRSES